LLIREAGWGWEAATSVTKQQKDLFYNYCPTGPYNGAAASMSVAATRAGECRSNLGHFNQPFMPHESCNKHDRSYYTYNEERRLAVAQTSATAPAACASMTNLADLHFPMSLQAHGNVHNDFYYPVCAGKKTQTSRRESRPK